jgi:hypothetical protein
MSARLLCLSTVTLVVVPSLLGCGVSSPSEAEVSRSGITASEPENPDVEAPEAIADARDAITRAFGPLSSEDTAVAAMPDGYGHLDPQRHVPRDLLEKAVSYFDAHKEAFPNQAFLTIVDFKPRSDRYRFFLVDLRTGAVERYHTTHGRGGDLDHDGYVETFGNEVDSGKSSLGFARTAEVYWGTYNRSLRLDGLSATNSRIRERAIVFHSFDGVKEENIIQPRTRGCVTLDWAIKDIVLDKIKEGSLMYVGVAGKPHASVAAVGP